jgi:hypothetical protein
LDGALVVLGHLGLVVMNNMSCDAFAFKTIIDGTLDKDFSKIVVVKVEAKLVDQVKVDELI